jgi:hypothetical protein
MSAEYFQKFLTKKKYSHTVVVYWLYVLCYM